MHVYNNDDYDRNDDLLDNNGFDFDDEDDDNESESIVLGLGMGISGKVSSFIQRGDGSVIYSDDDDDEDPEEAQIHQEEVMFYSGADLDEDGEAIPRVMCFKCITRDCTLLDAETDLYQCKNCKREFTPKIFERLDTAEAYINRAERNNHNGRYKRAIKDATAALELDPNNANAYYWRGITQFLIDKHQESINDLNKAISLSPEFSDAYLYRGASKCHIDDIEAGMEDLNTAIELKPENAAAYVFRAGMHYKAGNYSDAIDDYSELVCLKPDALEGYFNRGQCFALSGEHMNAIYDFTYVLNEGNDELDVFYERARSQEELGHDLEAFWDYLTILNQIDPCDLKDEIQEKVNALQDKIGPEADQWLPVFTNPDRFGESAHLMMSAHFKTMENQMEESIEDISKAIKLTPNYAILHIVRGDNYKALGKIEESIEEYSRANRLGIGLTAFVRRGMAYAELGDHEKAIGEFQHVIEESLVYDQVLWAAFYNRASSYLDLKEFDKAIADCAEAISIYETEPRPYKVRAQAYIGTGDEKAALLEFQRYLNLIDDYEEYEDGEEREEAIEIISELRRKIEGTEA